MAQRRRDIDNAMRVTPKQIRLATAIVAGLGLLALAWAFFASGDWGRRAELRRVQPGDPAQVVTDRLGAAPADCPTGALEHLRTQFPEDFAPAAVDEAIERMRGATAHRWVYPTGGSQTRCRARNGDTEFGISSDGADGGGSRRHLPPRDFSLKCATSVS
jgi:hypothetical protein